MQDSFEKIFGNKNKIMFVFAHPDDAEIYTGGTIARLVECGKQVKLVKMTAGNKGSRGEKVTEDELAITREREDKQALTVLGLGSNDSTNLNLGDGEIENSLKVIGRIVEEVRRFKPDLIVTHNPEQVLIRDLEGFYYINHRDHRNTGMSAVDATYPYSRDTLFYPEHIENGMESHSTTELLFVDSWGHQDTIYVDVSDQIAKKIEAINCHKSQFSQDRAQSLVDFFAPEVDGKRFEQFRYVIAD